MTELMSLTYGTQKTSRRTVLVAVVAALALATGLAVSGVAAQKATATISADSVSLPNSTVGDTANSTITVDAAQGLASADVNVSVNSSVVEIIDVRKGSGVESIPENYTEFKPNVSANNGSAGIRYSSPLSGPASGFSLAVIEVELVSDNLETPINLTADNVNYLNSTNGSESYNTQVVNGTVLETPFASPLSPKFNSIPQNIDPSNGGLDPVLYEDLSGDGEPLDLRQTVEVYRQIFRNELNGGDGLGLSSDVAARKLNWDDSTPKDTVKLRDMVQLYREQFRAQLGS
jgi:hypothetical protein